jgi:hypothetical protein
LILTLETRSRLSPVDNHNTTLLRFSTRRRGKELCDNQLDMILSPTRVSPSWRSIGPPILYLSIWTSPYTTSAILHSPSPLKMDAQNVYAREWAKRNRESVNILKARWRQENLDKKREWSRLKYERDAMHVKFCMWLVRNDWPFRQLTWRTHIPIKTEEKVKRACSNCGRYEFQGLRIWWKRRNVEPSTPAAYDCFDCFSKPNPEHVVPIGYEGLSLEDAYNVLREARKQHDEAARSKARERHPILDTAAATVSAPPNTPVL